MHMIRPLIASVACAAATFGTAARAESQVNLYGVVSTDFVSASNVYENGKSSRRTSLDGGRWAPSRFGLRGSEDLGGGLSATFNLEAGLSPDTGAAAGTFWNRGSHVGLKGDFGQVTFGRQWNLNDDVMCGYFICGGYAAFSYTEFGWLSDTVNNSVKYYSPSFGGVQLGVLYGFGEQPGSTSAGSTLELSGTYSAGPLSVGLTHHQSKALVGSEKDKLTSLGASYSFGELRARLAYAVSDFEASGLDEAATYDLGIDWFGLPSIRLSLDYVARDLKGSGDDSHFIRLVGDYSLSKRTGFTANVIYLKNRGDAAEAFYGEGAPGQSQTVFTVGVRHSF
ncbi:putative porin [Caldimonas thermodepolymerans]|uniref:Porin n=2 Tax=Caldimonas thermodepolymerans TaxID=215580 RepID=A0AA46DAB7_9BURK|nr:putative porin [Caldimonas thermodepolymerans]